MNGSWDRCLRWLAPALVLSATAVTLAGCIVVPVPVPGRVHYAPAPVVIAPAPFVVYRPWGWRRW